MNDRYCKCGCGAVVKRDYKKGHANKGKKFSLEHCSALSIAQKKLNKKLTLEQKQHLSAINKGKKFSDEVRAKLSIIAKSKGFGKWMKGRKISAETNKKMIESRKKSGKNKRSEECRKKISLANSGEGNGCYGKIYTQKEKDWLALKTKQSWQKPEIREKRIAWTKTKKGKKILRKNAIETALKCSKYDGKFFNTKPELEMKKLLGELEIEFIHNYPVWGIEHSYCSDFYLPAFNTILEVDGVYFHNYPYGTDLDKIRENELKDIGYNVIRFWEGKFDKQQIQCALKLDYNLQNTKEVK